MCSELYEKGGIILLSIGVMYNYYNVFIIRVLMEQLQERRMVVVEGPKIVLPNDRREVRVKPLGNQRLTEFGSSVASVIG